MTSLKGCLGPSRRSFIKAPVIFGPPMFIDSATANKFVNNPLFHDALAIVKGLRNGLVYGAKIRFPHALVMTFLFRDDPYKMVSMIAIITICRLPEKIKFILAATKQHSWNLGKFVTIFKTMKLILKLADGGVEKSHHAFLAGCVGGYAVFRNDNPVNNQIVMYLLSRVAIGLVKLAYQATIVQVKATDGTGRLSWLAQHGFEIEATIVWGLVMWLFTHYRHVLQPSLQASMQYLYVDSNTWDSLWTLLVHNK